MDNHCNTQPALQGELVGVVGYACRVAGATNPSELWDAMVKKKDLRRKIPETRYNADAHYHPVGANKGTTNAMYGYFLDQNVGLFDAGFFKISRQEAEAMDPQQRLILEVVYEALEHARIPLEIIAGSSTSVYCGSFSDDYSKVSASDMEDYPKYAITGTGRSILANRVSYFYDIHGESISVDTACSSSLICLHLANQSIMSGSSDIAIIIGSALHLDPGPFITMADFGMLSPDGRSRAFDASGQGYARGEGVCAMILKKVSRAHEHGDMVRAVIRATGVGHDGLKNGITLPSPEAQEALIRRTYRNAHINTRDTAFIEAHGTGTPAGDPREAKAIGAVFGNDGRFTPILMGSIKSVIGHLEGAAGIVGLIKAVMCIEKGNIAGNMHFVQPNPNIDFKAWNLRVPTGTLDWPESQGPRRASVNSFGYGGSNAHAVVEQYLPIEDAHIGESDNPIGPPSPKLVPLTSHSANAGTLFAQRLEEYLIKNPECDITRLAYTLSIRRTMHEYRAYVVGSTAQEMVAQVKSMKSPSCWTSISDTNPRIGFVFTGQGAQYARMGQDLAEQVPVYRNALERCSNALSRLPDRPKWNIFDELSKSSKDSSINSPEFSQPLCTAVQIALLELLKSWNIIPCSVVGHSSGEIAAAYAAGIITLESAMIISYYRGLYTSITPADTKAGSMMAVGMTPMDARAAIKEYSGRLSIAAINSPTSATISGDEDAMLDLQQELQSRNVFIRKLVVKQAYHSHHMLASAERYLQALKGCKYIEAAKDPQVRMVSSLSARVIERASIRADYWVQNLVSSVRFMDALTGVLLDEDEKLNVSVLIEIGPHSVLKGPSVQVMQSLNCKVPYFATLMRNTSAHTSILATAGQLFKLGYPLNLECMSLGTRDKTGSTKAPILGHLQDFPSYSWDHDEYWFRTRKTKTLLLKPYTHILLGQPTSDSTSSCHKWRNFLRLREIPWLADHKIQNTVIFPAAGYISMAVEAMLRTNSTSEPAPGLRLTEITLKAALQISDTDTGVEILFELTTSGFRSSIEQTNSRKEFRLLSYSDDGSTIEHCNGSIAFCSPGLLEASPNLTQSGTDRAIPAGSFYKTLQSAGLNYQKQFRLIDGDLSCGPGVCNAFVRLIHDDLALTEAGRCILHPCFLDACFHPMFAALEALLDSPLSEAAVPIFINSLEISDKFIQLSQANISGSDFLGVTVNANRSAARGYRAGLDLYSESGKAALIKVRGLDLAKLGKSLASIKGRELFSRVRWLPAFHHLDWLRKPLDHSFEELLDMFAHQYPKAAILIIAADPLHLLSMLIQRLSNNLLEHRRFATITLTSANRDDDGSGQRVELPAEWSSFVEPANPVLASYDLVLVGSTTDRELQTYLKPDGSILVPSGVEFPNLGLAPRFETKGPKCFKLPEPTLQLAGPSPERIALVVLDQVCEKISEVAAEMTRQGLVVEIWDFESAGKNPHSLPATIVVVVNLEKDMLWESSTAESDAFHAVKNILLSEGKHIIWALRGVTFESERPQQAVILGIIRTARNENSLSRITVLDIALDYDSVNTGMLLSRLVSTRTIEEELSERNDIVYIARVVPDDDLNAKLESGYGRILRPQSWAGPNTLALRASAIGSIKSLAFEATNSTAMGPNDLELQVLASGISHRDLNAVLGNINTCALGGDCTGIVRRKGTAVTDNDFEIGNCVLAMMPGQGTHKNFVRALSSSCVKINRNDAINAVSCCFDLTLAIYSLMKYARIHPGERVLIYAGASTSGQMAIQVCKILGAVFTAVVQTSAEQECLAKKLQVQPSQLLLLADSPRHHLTRLSAVPTEKFDVILNDFRNGLTDVVALLLAPFGRFIELGSNFADRHAPCAIEVLPPGASYCEVTLSALYATKPPIGATLLQEVYDVIHKIQKPDIRIFSFSKAAEAYQFVQSDPGMIKVVLSNTEDNGTVAASPILYEPGTQLFDPCRTYLLVGGFSGLGCSMALWMTRKGARHLAFFSRSGPTTENARETIKALRAREIKIRVFEGDVTKLGSIQLCIDSLRGNLAGVFQMALVLRDNLLRTMSYQQWKATVEVKATGTRNLDIATQDCNLDFFICFSSASAILGTKGQANYAAGNLYMDALMKNRRLRGLPGTTLNIGMVVGIGLISEDNDLEARMRAIGFDALSEHEMYRQIEEGILGGSSMETADPMSREMHQIITGVRVTSKDVFFYDKAALRCMASILDNELANAPTFSSNEFDMKTLMALAEGEAEKVAVILEAFSLELSSVTGLSVQSINPNKSLSSYGIDSLVALDIRSWFMKSIGAEVALFNILGSESISTLAAKAWKSVKTGNPEDRSRSSNSSATVQNTGTSRTRRLSRSPELPQTSFNSQRVLLSEPQMLVWSHRDLFKLRGNLILISALYIDGEPNVSILQRAIRELIDRNEVLRTVILPENSSVWQKPMAGRGQFDNFVFHDISNRPNPQRVVDHFIDDMAESNFRTEVGEMFHVALLKTSPESYAFVCAIHTLAADRNTAQSLLNQLMSIYDCYARDQDIRAVVKPEEQYVNFTLQYDEFLSSEQGITRLGFWRSHLEGYQNVGPLLSFARISTLSGLPLSTSHVTASLKPRILARMRRISSEMGGAVVDFFICALRAFLSYFTGSSDLVINLLDNNAAFEENGSDTGLLSNILPLRFPELTDQTFEDLFATMKQQISTALENRGIAYETIIDALDVKSESTFLPLGQICVGYDVQAPVSVYRTLHFTAEHTQMPYFPNACELGVEATETLNGELEIYVSYISALYKEDDMEKFSGRLLSFLRSVIRDHRQPLGAIIGNIPKIVAPAKDEAS